MAEQSWYIKKYKEYMVNPKKFEYEAKKERIMRKKPFSYYLTYLTNLFFLVTFALIGRLFVYVCWDYDGEPSFLLGFEVLLYFALTVILGLANILAGGLWLDKSSEWRKDIVHRYNEKELNALYDKYRKYGVYEVQLEEIYKNKCGELSRGDNWICSATGERISYRKVCECWRDGCRKCQILSDVLYNSIDMDVVRENERKFNESERLNEEKAKTQKSSDQKEAVSDIDDELMELMQQGEPVKKSVWEKYEIVLLAISAIGAIVMFILYILGIIN